MYCFALLYLTHCLYVVLDFRMISESYCFIYSFNLLVAFLLNLQMCSRKMLNLKDVKQLHSLYVVLTGYLIFLIKKCEVHGIDIQEA